MVKITKPDIDPVFIKSIFDYSPSTGIITWKITLSQRNAAGNEAGYRDEHGRIKIGIKKKVYMAHRIIWAWMTGHWPDHEIDHRDGCSANNRWKNLREATHSQNQHNKT